jgi:hypothetical protein
MVGTITYKGSTLLRKRSERPFMGLRRPILGIAQINPVGKIKLGDKNMAIRIFLTASEHFLAKAGARKVRLAPAFAY